MEVEPFVCDNCGKISKVLVHGYPFGDRLLEDVMFIVEDRDRKPVVIGVTKECEEYFQRLNHKMWFDVCKVHCEDLDIAECPECGEDVAVWYWYHQIDGIGRKTLESKIRTDGSCHIMVNDDHVWCGICGKSKEILTPGISIEEFLKAGLKFAQAHSDCLNTPEGHRWSATRVFQRDLDENGEDAAIIHYAVWRHNWNLKYSKEGDHERQVI